VGTRVEIGFGRDGVSGDGNPLLWIHQADLLSNLGPHYSGGSSPHWYDAESAFELFQAAGDQTVRALIATFAGCSGSRAGRVASEYHGRPGASLSRAEVGELLARLRSEAPPVKASRLGHVGREAFAGHGYARVLATVRMPCSAGTTLPAEVPIVVEAWAEVSADCEFIAYVNRSPITGEITAWSNKNDFRAHGCGLGIRVPQGRRGRAVTVNVEAPYLPLCDDGKQPDFSVANAQIAEAVRGAVRRARGNEATRGPMASSLKKAIMDQVPAAASKAGGDGRFRYSPRQLFYVVRDALGELDWNYFCQVLTMYENEYGDLHGLHRDARGIVYHPHLGEEIPLGTLNVETYRRPPWTFRHALYCEKEGFIRILRDARWPERHDTALLTSKGFASRAARDLLDLLGDHDEEVTLFCIHDADGSGTLIYETLQEGTAARPGRRVKVINLGLEPREAREMGLAVETFERAARAVPVAGYVDDDEREWLQTHRIELNAMTTDQFLDWLDRKFEQYDAGRLVPPVSAARTELRECVERRARQELVDRVVRETHVEARVEALVKEVLEATRTRAFNRDLIARIHKHLERVPEDWWRTPVAGLANDLVGEALTKKG
jgi:hypothetical protein